MTGENIKTVYVPAPTTQNLNAQQQQPKFLHDRLQMNSTPSGQVKPVKAETVRTVYVTVPPTTDVQQQKLSSASDRIEDGMQKKPNHSGQTPSSNPESENVRTVYVQAKQQQQPRYIQDRAQVNPNLRTRLVNVGDMQTDYAVEAENVRSVYMQAKQNGQQQQPKHIQDGKQVNPNINGGSVNGNNIQAENSGKVENIRTVYVHANQNGQHQPRFIQNGIQLNSNMNSGKSNVNSVYTENTAKGENVQTVYVQVMQNGQQQLQQPRFIQDGVQVISNMNSGQATDNTMQAENVRTVYIQANQSPIQQQPRFIQDGVIQRTNHNGVVPPILSSNMIHPGAGMQMKEAQQQTINESAKLCIVTPPFQQQNHPKQNNVQLVNQHGNIIQQYVGQQQIMQIPQQQSGYRLQVVDPNGNVVQQQQIQEPQSMRFVDQNGNTIRMVDQNGNLVMPDMQQQVQFTVKMEPTLQPITQQKVLVQSSSTQQGNVISTPSIKISSPPKVFEQRQLQPKHEEPDEIDKSNLIGENDNEFSNLTDDNVSSTQSTVVQQCEPQKGEEVMTYSNGNSSPKESTQVTISQESNHAFENEHQQKQDQSIAFMPPSSRMDENYLVRENDSLLLTRFSYFVMLQLQRCFFMESDRKSRGGKRDSIKLGFSGIQCIHCANEQKSRKFFWCDVDKVANSFAEIPNHVMKCRHTPDEVRDKCLQLKATHATEMAKKPRGSQKVYFRRMWRRLHDNPHNAPSQNYSQNGIVQKPQQGSQSMPRRRNLTLLAIQDDSNWLSDLDCLLRRNLEVFKATEKEAITSKSISVRVGQVGIRCIHCSSCDQGVIGSASYFPPSISKIHECVRSFQKCHLESCVHVPPVVRKELESISLSSSLSSMKKKYYALAANALGLVDTIDGIRYMDDLKAKTILSQKRSAEAVSSNVISNNATTVKLLPASKKQATVSQVRQFRNF